MTSLDQRTLLARLLAPVVLAVVAAAELTAQQKGQLAQFSSQVQLVEVYATSPAPMASR